MKHTSVTAPERAQPIVSARLRISVAIAAGLVSGIVAELLGLRLVSVLVGWDVTAAVFLVWVASTVMRYDETQTARHASAEDPSRAVADGLLLAASLASLIAVGFVLFQAGDSSGLQKIMLVAVAAVSVALSWLMVHTVYALHYARLFFETPTHGIDFNAADPGEGQPTYSDFAYVAFTIGMTFQVSDTNLRTKEIRAAALRHALLSYLIGAVVLSMAINLLAGMSK